MCQVINLIQQLLAAVPVLSSSGYGRSFGLVQGALVFPTVRGHVDVVDETPQTSIVRLFFIFTGFCWESARLLWGIHNRAKTTKRFIMAKAKAKKKKKLKLLRGKCCVDLFSKTNFPKDRVWLIGLVSPLIKLPRTPQLWKRLCWSLDQCLVWRFDMIPSFSIYKHSSVRGSSW